MFISDKEADNRVSSIDNLINKLELRRIHNGGRPKGRKNDTLETRLAIAERAIEVGPTKAAAEHNTTPARASLLSNGIVTHSQGSNEKLAPAVMDKKTSIHEKALDIITSSLINLEGKLDEVKKPSELAAIAVEMAKIASKTGSPQQKAEESGRPNVNVIIYAPRMRDEGEYEVLDITDKIPNKF